MSAALDKGSTTYWAIHKWVARHHQKTGRCELCGESKPRTEWAMRVHGDRRRDRDAWIEACPPCHIRYDIDHNGKLHGARPRLHSQR